MRKHHTTRMKFMHIRGQTVGMISSLQLHWQSLSQYFQLLNFDEYQWQHLEVQAKRKQEDLRVTENLTLRLRVSINCKTDKVN